jgi:sarcosine oxidase subunit beta
MHYPHPAEARLALASLPWFEEWRERVGGECGFTRTGFLQLVAPADNGKLRAAVARLREVGVETELLLADELRRLQPQLEVDDGELAAYEPRGGYADPVATARAFAAAAVDRGARLLEGTAVTAISLAGGRIAGVETTAGRIAAAAVVLANGNWSTPLLHSLGLELPIHPTRVQLAFFSRPPAMPRGPAGHCTIIDRRYGYYSRPNGEDETLVGLSAYHRPLPALDDWPWSNDPEFPPLALDQFARRIPAAGRGTYLRGHMGPLDVTPDGRAILGLAPGVDGLYLAVGMSGTGFKKAPAIGCCMAELVTTGEATTAPIHAFRPTRFAEGDLFTSDEYSLPEDAVDAQEIGRLRGRGLIH